MGFKSRQLPSVEVFAADGDHCRAFVAKAKGPEDVGGDSSLSK
jgi:hypothetical protein